MQGNEVVVQHGKDVVTGDVVKSTVSTGPFGHGCPSVGEFHKGVAVAVGPVDRPIAADKGGHGQHDPEFLNLMADYLMDKQLDMVIGSRFIEKRGFQSSKARRVGIIFFAGLIKLLTGKRITDPTSGLRMVGRNVMALFAVDYPRDYPEPESVVAVLRRNMKVEEIPVIMHERMGGVSSISLKKSVYYMVKVTLAILIERIRKY